jgi:hypothetical protein
MSLFIVAWAVLLSGIGAQGTAAKTSVVALQSRLAYCGPNGSACNPVHWVVGPALKAFERLTGQASSSTVQEFSPSCITTGTYTSCTDSGYPTGGGGGAAVTGPVQPVTPEDAAGDAPPAPGVYRVRFIFGTVFEPDTCVVTVPKSSGPILAAPSYAARCIPTTSSPRVPPTHVVSCSSSGADCGGTGVLYAVIGTLAVDLTHTSGFDGALDGLVCKPAGKKSRCSWTSAYGMAANALGGAGGVAVISWKKPSGWTASLQDSPPSGIYTVSLFGYTCTVTVPPSPAVELTTCNVRASVTPPSSSATTEPATTTAKPTSGTTVSLNHAYAYFPGSAFDSDLTHSYSGAAGTVTVPPNGAPGCLVNVTGLQSGVTYAVYTHAPGVTKGEVNSTAGPWSQLGTFVASGDGTGTFQCAAAPQAGSALAVNVEPQDGMILISAPLPS